MADPRYRRGRAFAADMAVYTRTISADNCEQHQHLKRNLIRALQEEVTPLQRKYLLLYYSEGLRCGRSPTASGGALDRLPHHHRGEERLRRCLRYGAAALLPRSG